jgi:secondary thiamine-phosphate synthase enzyme
MHRQTLQLAPTQRGLHDLTAQIAEIVRRSEVHDGMCHAFLLHTSASLVIQENADPDVLADLADWFARAAPDGDPRHRHTDEGPDDMPSHIRAALTQPSLTIPVVDGALALGTWKGIYLFEHRLRPHTRRLIVTVW